MICTEKEMIFLYLYLLKRKVVTLLVFHLDKSPLKFVAPWKATLIQTIVVVNVYRL